MNQRGGLLTTIVCGAVITVGLTAGLVYGLRAFGIDILPQVHHAIDIVVAELHELIQHGKAHT